MKAWLIGLIAITPHVSAEAVAPKRIAAADLPQLVAEKNENVGAAGATLKAQQERTGYLTRSFLPGFSAQLGTEQFKAEPEGAIGRPYWRLEARVNLYRGGKDALEEKARQASATGAQVAKDLEFQKELRDARKAYWGLVALNSLDADLELALSRNQGNLESAKRRTGAGVSTAADTLQFELRNTLLTQNRKKLLLERDMLRNRLSVALGLDEHENLEVADTFTHPPDDGHEVAPFDPKSSLQVKNVEAEKEALKFRAEKEKRWWHPSLEAYVGYGQPSLDDEYERAAQRRKEAVAGLRLGISLGEGFEQKAEAKALSFQNQALEQRVNRLRRETEATEHEIRHDMRFLHELIHDADKDIQTAERFVKLTLTEYNRGVKNGPDLLAASERYFEFRQRRTELFRSYYEAQAELLALSATTTN